MNDLDSWEEDYDQRCEELIALDVLANIDNDKDRESRHEAIKINELLISLQHKANKSKWLCERTLGCD